jgi:hypothetical protein
MVKVGITFVGVCHLDTGHAVSLVLRSDEDFCSGSGVAILLVRDRDGQLKSSFDGLQDNNDNKRFLSTVQDCAVKGNRMDFEVRGSG